LAKEAVGGDNLAVGVRLPDGTDFSPILVEGYQVLYSKEGAGDEWRALTDLRLQ
jgi:hypothetical protein